MPRNEWFVVDDRARVLERHVEPARGRPYVHRVGFDDIEKIAYGIGELADSIGSFTMWHLAEHEFGVDEQKTPLRTSICAVVLAFAREETLLVDRVGRAHVAVDDYDPLDLMLEVTGFNQREYSDE